MKSILKMWVFDLIDYVGLLIGYVPIHSLRLFYYRVFLKAKIGKDTSIHRCCQIRRGDLIIGNNVIIGENVLLDARGGLTIDDNVNVSSNVSFYTYQHDYNSPDFAAVGASVKICKNAWISCNSVVLPGSTVNEGAVVGAMCLVNKDVPAYTLVGGVPFKVIKERNKDIQYRHKFHKRFQ